MFIGVQNPYRCERLWALDHILNGTFLSLSDDREWFAERLAIVRYVLWDNCGATTGFLMGLNTGCGGTWGLYHNDTVFEKQLTTS